MKKTIYVLLFLLSSVFAYAQQKSSYEYDNLYRLTKVNYSGGVSVSYTYDALGNRVTKEVGGTVAVTGVTLNKSSTELEVGATEQLTATVLPANATNKNVIWTSDKSNIATVSSSGLITGKAVGQATITVQTEDGNHTETCVVTVKDNTAPVVDTPASNGFAECQGVDPDLNSDYRAWLAANGGATATDNCTGVTWSNNSEQAGWSGSSCANVITIEFYAADDYGNVTTTTASFTIIDTTGPIISPAAGNIAVMTQGDDPQDNPAYLAWLANNGGAEATDNCGGEVTWSNNSGTATWNRVGNSSQITITFTAADACGNNSSSTATFSVGGAVSITGKYSYLDMDPTHQPLEGVTVQLVGSSVTYTTVTDEDGIYTFESVIPGDYTVISSCGIPSDGAVNSLDAGMVNAWQVGPPYKIEKVRFKAADVIFDNYLAAGDAGRINYYFLSGGNPSWTAPATIWSFWKAGEVLTVSHFQDGQYPVITVGNSDIIQDFYGLVTGDFNLSMPGYLLKSASIDGAVKLNDGKAVGILPGKEIIVPVRIETPMTVGAFSLILGYPYDIMDIEMVFLGDDPSKPVPFNVLDNQLRISWFTLDPLVLATNQTLFTIVASVRENVPMDTPLRFTLVPNKLNEIGDQKMAVIPDAGLLAPFFTVMATSVNMQIAENGIQWQAYPNPTRGKLTIEMTGAGIRDAEVTIYTLQGAMVFKKAYRAGDLIEIDMTPYTSGVYMVRTEVEGSTFMRKVILDK